MNAVTMYEPDSTKISQKMDPLLLAKTQRREAFLNATAKQEIMKMETSALKTANPLSETAAVNTQGNSKAKAWVRPTAKYSPLTRSKTPPTIPRIERHSQGRPELTWRKKPSKRAHATERLEPTRRSRVAS